MACQVVEHAIVHGKLRSKKDFCRGRSRGNYPVAIKARSGRASARVLLEKTNCKADRNRHGELSSRDDARRILFTTLPAASGCVHCSLFKSHIAFISKRAAICSLFTGSLCYGGTGRNLISDLSTGVKQ